MANRWGKIGKRMSYFILFSSKINVDGDCSHKIKRRLLFRTAITNLNTVLKSRDITLPTKVRIVKAINFPVVTSPDARVGP